MTINYSTKRIIVNLVGILFILGGIILGYLVYYENTAKVERFEGIFVNEYTRWPTLLLITPSILVTSSPIFGGPYHLIFRNGNITKDFNYFTSTPTGRLIGLRKNETYSLEYNPSNHRIYNLRTKVNIAGKEINQEVYHSYGSSFSKLISIIILGPLSVLLFVIGCLCFLEKTLQAKK